MGGYWSGRRSGAKRRVEQCLALGLPWMLKNHYLDLGVCESADHSITWSNYRNDPIYTLTFELARASLDRMRLYLHTTTQAVYLHATTLHFGGVRWWFGCPGCDRRCAKLYHRPQSLFLCRICHDLTYESCIEGKSEVAFLASFAAQKGMSAVSVKRAVADDMRARNKWRRKRDRRAGYKARAGHLREIPETSLRRRMLEAKVANDLARSMERFETWIRKHPR
jgi:hypothetical protein